MKLLIKHCEWGIKNYMNKYLYFAKILYRTTEKRPLKEIFVGILLSVVLCFFIWFYPNVAFMVTLGYFSFYQITCMFDNEVFWDKKELKFFCIEKKSNISYFMV